MAGVGGEFIVSEFEIVSRAEEGRRISSQVPTYPGGGDQGVPLPRLWKFTEDGS